MIKIKLNDKELKIIHNSDVSDSEPVLRPLIVAGRHTLEKRPEKNVYMLVYVSAEFKKSFTHITTLDNKNSLEEELKYLYSEISSQAKFGCEKESTDCGIDLRNEYLNMLNEEKKNVL